MSELEPETPLLFRKVGQVKWFDPARGFGFVIDDQTGDEILLHANAIRSFGQSSVSAGSFVEMDAVATERGYQVRKVINIFQCKHVEAKTSDVADLLFVSEEYVAARVKWFDAKKGFGFVNVFGCPEDHYVHANTLHQGGLESVATGEAIGVRLGETPKGSIVVAASSWAVPTK